MNEKNATATEFLDLIEKVRSKAAAERGIDLEMELQVVGEESAIHE